MEQSDLLMRLTDFIDANGGRERLAHTLEMEWFKSDTRGYHNWDRAHVDFILGNYEDLTIDQIAKVLNLTRGVIKHKVSTLKSRKLLKNKRNN